MDLPTSQQDVPDVNDCSLILMLHDGACGAFRNDLTCKVHADLDDGDSVAPITNVAASVTRTQLLLAHNDDYNDPVLGTVSHTVDIWMSMNDRAAECRNGSNQ
ncbi:hypothetical protein EGR_10414 [Echinococcus granulosus]|uniref:Uncharacterized protein n=1 Tax=Echinococcus granulosus TaxID=6210 RepID=W6U117_ECHGR|nr:hypothetical protein EGR_10414 [Echinococcus granulosus]EUB54733.1 hypothetical protein EGR_10414 [Echinococcus granulosus]